MSFERRDKAGVPVCDCSGEDFRVHELPAEAGWFRYFDAEAEAVDRINWHVIRGEVAPLIAEGQTDVYTIQADEADDVPDGFIGETYGRYYCRGRLHTRPDSTADDKAAELSSDLADYYTLDEMAVSEAEHEEWCRWWFGEYGRGGDGLDDFLRGYTLADVIDREAAATLIGQLPDPRARAAAWRALNGWDAEEDARELLEVAGIDVNGLASATNEAMGYCNGWSGEYDADGAFDGLREYVGRVIAETIVAPLAAWPTCRDQLALALAS